MSDPTVNFEPQAVSYWFSKIMQLPHASGQEDALREAMYEWLTGEIGIDVDRGDRIFYQKGATAPGERVIYVYRHGTSTANKPIVLQAHLDMVVVTSPAVPNPFPLQPILDAQGWLTAHANGSTPENTILSTLGADDGIGVATALALLQDADLKGYPIECLFTVQEETDMGGAKYFDTDLLQGRQYINLDDERSGTITCGSAGGLKTTYSGAVKREKMAPERSIVKIVLGGLRGGHSGVDIAKGRPSAIALLVDGLCRMNARLNESASYDYRLISFRRTDVVKSNAIPTEATAILAVRASDVAPLKSSFESWFSALEILYGPTEPKMKMTFTSSAASNEEPLTASTTDNLLSFLRLEPQGVIANIPDITPAVVETSSNLYDVILDGSSTAVTVEASTRTSNPTLLGTQQAHLMTPLAVMLTGLGEAYGLTVETGGSWYPAWPPNKSSALLARASAIWEDRYKEDFEMSVIHAGLECGWIVSRYSDMDCIAAGPTIQNPHTTSERLDTHSVLPFYTAVKALLKSLFEGQKSAGAAK